MNPAFFLLSGWQLGKNFLHGGDPSLAGFQVRLESQSCRKIGAFKAVATPG